MPFVGFVYLTGDNIPWDRHNICKPRAAVCVKLKPIFTLAKNKQTTVHKERTAPIWVSLPNGVVNRLLIGWKQYKKALNTTRPSKKKQETGSTMAAFKISGTRKEQLIFTWVAQEQHWTWLIKPFIELKIHCFLFVGPDDKDNDDDDNDDDDAGDDGDNGDGDDDDDGGDDDDDVGASDGDKWGAGCGVVHPCLCLSLAVSFLVIIVIIIFKPHKELPLIIC